MSRNKREGKYMGRLGSFNYRSKYFILPCVKPPYVSSITILRFLKD